MPIGRFIGGVGAVVWSPTIDKYLLLRRSEDKDFASGIWECVTGRVDQGEGLEDALQREVQEELGVDVEIEFFIGTTHFYRGAEQPENELIGIVCCVSLENPDAIRVSTEHSEYRWVSIDEARQMLADDRAGTQWILGVLERVESLQVLTPPSLRDFTRQRGIELG